MHTSVPHRKPLTIQGKVVGMIFDRELVKVAQGSKHMLRSPKAWAFDARALAAARDLGVTTVRVEDQETGRVYRADLSAIYAHGYRFNRGFGEQIALQLQHWQLEGAPAPLVQEPLFA